MYHFSVVKLAGGNNDIVAGAQNVAANRMLGRTNCVVKDTKNYADNPVNAWFYKDILEASIAH